MLQLNSELFEINGFGISNATIEQIDLGNLQI